MKTAKWGALLGGAILLAKSLVRLPPLSRSQHIAAYGLAGLVGGSLTLALLYAMVGWFGPARFRRGGDVRTRSDEAA